MKKLISPIVAVCLLIMLGCKNDDIEPFDPTDPINNKVYDLVGITNSNITGEATFTRKADGTTTVYIKVVNASDEIHPAEIHYNSKEQGGDLALTLNACNCDESITEVSALDDGTPVTFDDLIIFNGHINIYESPSRKDVIIAQTNIGINSN